MTYCQSIDCSSLADARTSVRTNEPPNRMRLLTYVDKHNIDNLSLVLRLRTHERTSLRGVEDSLRTGARPAQGTATTTDVDLRVEYGWGVRRLRGGLPTHVDVYYAGVSL